MSISYLTKPRIRLDSEAYQELYRQVLQRDGWRCQGCGTRVNLQIHHLQRRSQLGDDAEQNLITLCSECHSRVHLGSKATLHRVNLAGC